jgi:hypothetical protein
MFALQERGRSVYDGESWKKPDGAGDGNIRIPGQKSKSSPALATFNDQLHMVHLGDSSNDIWYSANSGGDWSFNERLVPNQRSKASPAIVGRRDRLHMVRLGDGWSDMWHSQFDPLYTYPTEVCLP